MSDEWSDEPIESTSSDALNRAKFAGMVASRIDACDVGQASTVYGLVGPWGSGKSSLINMIRERLSDDWKVATFSPWAAPNSNGLSYEFLAALASTLDGDDARSETAKKSVVKYLKYGTPFLGLIPIFGDAVSAIAEKGLDAIATAKPWHIEFEAVSQALLALGTRALIIADDIDRLDADELLAFLKIVRLLGRFPNVHYLVAYDQSTVEDLLRSHGIDGRSSAFMEKIVQYPFEVPPVAEAIKRKLLGSSIRSLLVDNGLELSEGDTERASELIGLLASALSTPRAHARFHEQLAAYSAMLSFEEIDFLDFAALTFLRVSHHDLFDSLPDWQGELRSGKSTGAPYDADPISEEGWKDRIAPLIRQGNAEVPHQVLSFLFPNISFHGMSYFSEHDTALSDERYFQRYFILGVGDDDVEDSLVRSAIEQLVVGVLSSEEIVRLTDVLDGPDRPRASLGYEKGLRLRKSSSAGVMAIVEFLRMRHQARIDDEPSIESPSAVLGRWLPREVFLVLSSAQKDRDEMISMFGENTAINLLLRIQRDRNNPERDVSRIMDSFAEYFSERIQNDFPTILEDRGKLWILLTLLVKATGKESIVGILDEVIGDDAAEHVKVAASFVTIDHWAGSNRVTTPELVFQGEYFGLALTEAARARLVGSLPASKPIGEIDDEDTSENNVEEFAVAQAKASMAGVGVAP